MGWVTHGLGWVGLGLGWVGLKVSTQGSGWTGLRLDSYCELIITLPQAKIVH
jgi:hypothetical protein